MPNSRPNNSGADLDHLRTQVGRLRTALALLAIAWMGATLWLFSRNPTPGPVLALERLEIVEPGGDLAFVLANSARPAPATMDGQVIMAGQEEERRMPSMIFFDGKGDEVGGMLMGVRETEQGFQASRHISLDGYKQDQTVVLAHYQDPNGALSGLMVSDRPRDRSVLEAMAELGLEPGATREEMQEAIMALPEEGRNELLLELFGVNRVFVGSSRQDEASLALRDGMGRPRILLSVPSEGEPSIRVLDEEGNEVARIPG
jgi:hypothetical protein